MNVPAGVGSRTPLGSILLWDHDRLVKASKWKADASNPEKQVVSLVAKSVLSLRGLRDVARSMELGAGSCGPRGIPTVAQPPTVNIVEPVLGSKRGRKNSNVHQPQNITTGLIPVDSPPVEQTPTQPMSTALALQPCRPRLDTRGAYTDIPAWFDTNVQIEAANKTLASALGGSRTVLEVWSFTASIGFKVLLLIATWFPFQASSR